MPWLMIIDEYIPLLFRKRISLSVTFLHFQVLILFGILL